VQFRDVGPSHVKQDESQASHTGELVLEHAPLRYCADEQLDASKQVLQTVAPAVSWNSVTPLHLVHAVFGSRSRSANPTLHLFELHGPEDPRAAKSPAPQATQGVLACPSSSLVPRAQGNCEHAPTEPEGVYWPLMHLSQGVAALRSLSLVPAAQTNAEQRPEDPWGTNWPSLHAAHGVEESKSTSIVPGVQRSVEQGPADPRGA
jgi:hypothetical protein